MEDQVLKHWNDKNIIVHKDSKYNLERIKRSLKRKAEYSLEDVMRAIDNYANVFHDEDSFFKYKWPLWIFLQRENNDVWFPELFHRDNWYRGQEKQNNMGVISGMFK